MSEDAPVNKKKLWIEISCLVLLLIGYSVFLSYYYEPAINHPDSNGYWAQGTLIAKTGHTTFKAESPVQYIGMHWLFTESGEFASRYPPGLPMAVAAVSYFFGPEKSVLINPILAVLTLLGVYLLTRSLSGPGWGCLAILGLAFNPVFNSHALSSISHMGVGFLLVWGVYLLVCWTKHGHILEAFGAGVLLGSIPTVRYPEALFCLGIIFFLLWHWRSRPRIWLHYLAAVGGALLPIIPLMIRNQLAFGAFWKTGYSLTNEQTGFGWDYFKQHWSQYIQNLSGDGFGVLLSIAVIGMILMIFLRKKDKVDNGIPEEDKLLRPFGILSALLIVPLILLYMAYYWDGMGGAAGSLRFLMPLFPLLSVLAAWTLYFLTHRLSRTAMISSISVIFAIYALWGIPTSLRECRTSKYQHKILALATADLRKNVPADSVVVASQGLLQHLDFIRNWRLAETSPRAGRGGFQNMNREGDDTPRPMQSGKLKEMKAKYEGLSGMALSSAISEDICSWSSDGNIYYIGSENELQNISNNYFRNFKYEIVSKIELPEQPQDMSAGRRGFMGNRSRRQGGDMIPPQGGPGGAPPGGGAFQPGGRFGGMDRRQQFFNPPGGMGGGGMGMNSLQGEKYLVIAKWKTKGNL